MFCRSTLERSVTHDNARETLSKSATLLWESDVPGRTLMLDRNNCELCNKMFPKKK